MLNKKQRQEYYKQNKERWRLYYIKNKEKIKAYSKANYVKVNNTTNTTITKQEYYKIYYQENKEKIKAYGKFYYDKYKEKVCQNSKDYYYYNKLPVELQEVIGIRKFKKNEKIEKPRFFKNSINTVLNEKPLIEFIEGKRTILFE